MSSLLAGLAYQVPATTVNRLCDSSLDAIAIAACAIKAGEANLIIAGGVESMSRTPYVMDANCCAALAKADLREALKQARVPMLVIATNAPNTILRTINASHIANIKQPQAFTKLMQSFL